eukprot:8534121-Ditylum_brightwellii.AAC.2
MSLSTIHGNFKLQDTEWGKVHKQLMILFVPEEESTGELDMVEITLQVSLNATGGDTKNNTTKNRITKFKMGNPEELINWRIQLNHAIWNKLCKSPESRFNMVEMLLGGKALQHWRKFKSQMMSVPILGVLDDEDEENSREEEEDDKEKKKKKEGHSSASAATQVGLTKGTYRSSMHKFMRYYFINPQYAARTQKHYL